MKEFFIAQSLETGLKNTYVFLDKNNNYYGRKVSFAYRFKMLQKKIDMQWVSNTMGHESLDITLQVYAHFIPRKEK